MKKVLMIDNYDSFTYNLVQYLFELGADVTVKRNDEIALPDVGKMKPDAIVISPGPCTPADAGISVGLVKEYSGKIPILGVCLGHQAIAEAFGGEIIRAPKIMHGKTSEISHDNRGVYKGLPNPFTATRYHSLCVNEEKIPTELEVTSRVNDEPNEPIMGLRHREHPTEGVQFHPESILTACGHDLLRNFLDFR